MLNLLIALTVMGGLGTIGGLVWTVIHYSRLKEDGGPPLGEGISLVRTRDADRGVATGENGWFRGKSTAVGMSGSVSYAALKTMIAARRWADAAPLLLMTGGMFTLMLFGALAILVGMEDKVAGVLLLVLVLYTIGRIVLRMVRA